MIGQDDHCRRTDKTTVFRQRIEIERLIGETRRQDAARDATRKVRVQSMSLQHAPTIFIYQFAHADTSRGQVQARFVDPAANRK